MSGLSREVIRWLQSLDLTLNFRAPKWDLSNGYLVAEILSWYFPQEVLMYSFINGTSLIAKQKNWSLLKNFVERKGLQIPQDLLDATIHCKEKAAVLLIENLFELLTFRKVKKPHPSHDPDFTDYAYQLQLPLHARSTATKAVKNNLRETEIEADKSYILIAQKAQKIIADHIEHRQQERDDFPRRFNIKPSLGQRSPRRHLPEEKRISDGVSDLDTPAEIFNFSNNAVLPPLREPSLVTVKEVKVKQLDKRRFHTLPVQSY